MEYWNELNTPSLQHSITPPTPRLDATRTTQQALPVQINVGIITISDRAARGQYDDLGGPALKQAAEGHGWKVVAETLVPDEKREIQRAIREQIGQGCQLILTTGGTGVARRDLTPEAVREIATRELPGFGEAMRMESLKLTRNAILSRNLAVVVEIDLALSPQKPPSPKLTRKRVRGVWGEMATKRYALVICLPGKPSGAVECLGFVAGAIPHCVEVLQEVPTSC